MKQEWEGVGGVSITTFNSFEDETLPCEHYRWWSNLGLSIPLRMKLTHINGSVVKFSIGLSIPLRMKLQTAYSCSRTCIGRSSPFNSFEDETFLESRLEHIEEIVFQFL